MATLLQARVPDEVAETAKARAKETHQSLSAYITDLLRRDAEAVRTAALWDDYERFYADPVNKEHARRDAAGFDATVADGLDDDDPVVRDQ